MMTVGSILSGGINLVRTKPHAVAIWGALYLAMCVALYLMIQPMMGPLMEAQQAAMANATGGAPSVTPFHAGVYGGIFLIEIVALLMMLVIFAAAFRAVVRPEAGAFGYLRFGMDELRLIAIAIMLGIAFFVLTIVLTLVLGIVIAIVGVATGPGAAMIFVGGLLYCAVFAALVYFQVRLSLLGALSVKRRTIAFPEAWHLTNGKFWTLFGAYFVIALVWVALMIAVIAVTNPGLLGAFAHGMKPEAIMAASQDQMTRQAAGLSPALIAQYLVSAVVGTVLIAVSAGAIATATEQLTGDDASPAD